jgi:hypothetical protein
MNTDLTPTFDALKALLEPYAEFFVVTNTPNMYNLDSYAKGDNGKPIFFAATRLGKRYVSYYLMCVYIDPGMLAALSPALKKRMQGKSCFNFTSVDPALFAELQSLTQRGFEMYKSKGWASPPPTASAPQP